MNPTNVPGLSGRTIGFIAGDPDCPACRDKGYVESVGGSGKGQSVMTTQCLCRHPKGLKALCRPAAMQPFLPVVLACVGSFASGVLAGLLVGWLLFR